MSLFEARNNDDRPPIEVQLLYVASDTELKSRCGLKKRPLGHCGGHRANIACDRRRGARANIAPAAWRKGWVGSFRRTHNDLASATVKH